MCGFQIQTIYFRSFSFDVFQRFLVEHCILPGHSTIQQRSLHFQLWLVCLFAFNSNEQTAGQNEKERGIFLLFYESQREILKSTISVERHIYGTHAATPLKRFHHSNFITFFVGAVVIVLCALVGWAKGRIGQF